MIRLVRYPAPSSKPLVATLGNFDGLHLGHQKLLRRVREIQSANIGLESALISFYPHPGVVLGKVNAIPKITSLCEKLEILDRLKFNSLYLIHFTPQFSKLTASAFIEDVLISKLNIQFLVLGPDARVGHKGQGDATFIETRMQQFGRSVEIQPFIEAGSEPISSRRVRAQIAAGNLEFVKAALGRHFSLVGRVVHGEKRGRKLGYPTANVHWRDQILPQYGIYAVWVTLSGETQPGVASIGMRPTFDGSKPSVEVYLPKYSGPEFYGKRIKVSLVKYIRPELKFSDLEALKSAMADDTAKALKILESECRT